VYLEGAAETAFQKYVDHEEDVRRRLIENEMAGTPLTEWKRAFFLSSQLRPTRGSVLDLDYMQDDYSDTWFISRAPHDSGEIVTANRALIDSFLAAQQLTDSPGHPQRTLAQRHLRATGVPVAAVLTELLTRVRLTRLADSQRYTGVLLQITAYLERNPTAVCSVYVMGVDEGRTTRLRRVNGNNEIDNIFQGAYPVERARRGEVYPGDFYIHDDVLTIQFHKLTLRDDTNIIAADVRAIAIWVPQSYSRDWLVQKSRAEASRG
jgi:hypothetical protein